MIAVRQKFEKETLSLDGGTFRECQFLDCILQYSAMLPVNLAGNSFTNCRWQWIGPAANTIALMHFLHQNGQDRLIEGLFESVRKGGAHSHAGHPHDHHSPHTDP